MNEKDRLRFANVRRLGEHPWCERHRLELVHAGQDLFEDLRGSPRGLAGRYACPAKGCTTTSIWPMRRPTNRERKTWSWLVKQPGNQRVLLAAGQDRPTTASAPSLASLWIVELDAGGDLFRVVEGPFPVDANEAPRIARHLVEICARHHVDGIFDAYDSPTRPTSSATLTSVLRTRPRIDPLQRLARALDAARG